MSNLIELRKDQVVEPQDWLSNLLSERDDLSHGLLELSYKKEIEYWKRGYKEATTIYADDVGELYDRIRRLEVVASVLAGTILGSIIGYLIRAVTGWGF